VSDEEVSYPVQVRQQVWESLLSMLRVYAHASGLDGKDYVVTGSAEEALVGHQGSVLKLHFDPGTGEANWRIKKAEQEEWGEFRIEGDGSLIFPAGVKPLDTAAIEWLEHLTHVASTGSNEPLSHPMGIS
jgi:hypothetical protein